MGEYSGRWCLIGIPDDTGVKNNKGRVGAAKAPSSFRKFFMNIKSREPVLETMADADDADIHPLDITYNHESAIEHVRDFHGKFDFSVVVGGGHDHAYTHLKGISLSAKKKTTIGCINIDPHLDVRKNEPQILSGSPFYMAIENKIIEGPNLIEFGTQYHCNAPELWDYAEENKVKILPFEGLRHDKAIGQFKNALKQLEKEVDLIIISLDMDAIQAAYAPGVSALASEGFTPTEIFEMMEIAGRSSKVTSLGIFELNPNYDIDDRTARIAAVAAFNFVRAKII